MPNNYTLNSLILVEQSLGAVLIIDAISYEVGQRSLGNLKRNSFSFFVKLESLPLLYTHCFSDFGHKYKKIN